MGEFSPKLEIEIVQFNKVFIIGKIQNLDATGDIIEANVYNIRVFNLSPFESHQFLSGEKIYIQQSLKLGILTPTFICGFYNIAI